MRAEGCPPFHDGGYISQRCLGTSVSWLLSFPISSQGTRGISVSGFRVGFSRRWEVLNLRLCLTEHAALFAVVARSRVMG